MNKSLRPCPTVCWIDQPSHGAGIHQFPSFAALTFALENRLDRCSGRVELRTKTVRFRAYRNVVSAYRLRCDAYGQDLRGFC